MKWVLRLTGVVVAGGVLGLFLVPLLVAAVIAGQLQAASQAAAGWDIPAQVVPALQEAGQQFGVPWFLLAGVASVATDFGRHAPDGRVRGDAPGTAVFPVVLPPIVAADGGAGMFLVDGTRAAAAPVDPQDVRAAAGWLAAQLASLAGGSPLAQGSLNDPQAGKFWHDLLAAAPLRITAPAATETNITPVDPGSNPIRQFGGAVMSVIGAPVSAANLDAFAAWAAGEGACANFNPLATTQPEPGAWPFNTLSGGGHVWNYPSFSVGVQATTTAMTNGLYQPVLDAFRASAGVAAVAAAVEASPWGTQTFGSPSYDAHQCGSPGADPAPAPPVPTITGPDAVVATILARAQRYESIWAETAAVTAAATTPSGTP